MIITNIKQAVHNENRVNVYVDGKYSFSLDITQVVDMRVKIGRVINESELADFKRASEFGKLYQRALEWVLTRPHSEKETHDYLYKKVYEKGLDKKYIDNIIERLTTKKYLDDRKFAAYYVENRFIKKGISKKRLHLELVKKGIDKNIIDETIDGSGRDDIVELDKMIIKKYNKYQERDKLIAYLCRQGFPYSLVTERLQSYETDLQNLG